MKFLSRSWMLLAGSAIVTQSFAPQTRISSRCSGPTMMLLADPGFPTGDRRPQRKLLETVSPEPTHHTDWGIVHFDSKPRFPNEMESVTLSAWEAIAATLYGKQRMDPNEVNNARSKSVYEYRAVRRDHDRGRIGIEIDGARHLFANKHHPTSDASAIRQISLMISARITNGPWEGFETATKEFTRPVAIYFNTIKQALVASQELGMLRRMSNDKEFDYENIVVKTLGQDPEIPKHMRRKKKITKGLPRGEVNPKQGVIVIVQPSDYNQEFRPPGPAIDSVSHLQQLVARAAVENLAVVVVSPRFLVHQSSMTTQWDQTGYQQSSIFGGDEPPRGPTPWILRDFFPPAFVWVGSAVPLVSRRRHHIESNSDKPYYFSRVAMMQSVMNECHAFHLYGAKEERENTSYQYLASTSNSAGRPTAAIVKFVFDEWSF